jgi:hypothetical protein
MLNIDFSAAINLSGSSLYSSVPQVVPNGKCIYVIWHESSGIYGPKAQARDAQQKQKAAVLYRVSQDNGSTFGEIRQLYVFQNLINFPPTVGVSPKTNTAMLAWSDIAYNDQYAVEVFFARAKNGSDQFETPRRLDNTQTEEKPDSNAKTSSARNPYVSAPPPRLSISSENVYLMWLGMKDLLAGKHRGEYGINDIDFECNVFFRASHDGGDHFTDPVSLDAFRVRGTHPGGGYLASIGPMSLKAKNNNVYVVWHQLGAGPTAGSVFFRKSTDGGKSFSVPIALNRMYGSGNVNTDPSASPSITANATVYLCDIEIDEDNESDKDELFAAWLVKERRADDSDLLSSFRLRPSDMKHTMYFAKIAGSDNGNSISFPTYTRITDSAWGGIDSFIRVTGDSIYAFWNDTNTGEISVRSSRDGGNTFGPQSGIKGTNPASRNSNSLPVGPYVLCQGNKIFAAWHGYLAKDGNDGPQARVIKPGGSPREYHLPRTVIKFSASSDNGTTFSDPASISQKDSWRPANIHLALSNEHIYTVCSEGSEWSPDIFFRVGRITS